MVENQELSVETYNVYIESLKPRFFKILPLFEENNEGIFNYVGSVLGELYGLQFSCVVKGKLDQLCILIVTLESFLINVLEADYDLHFIKREVFKCMTVIEKMKVEVDCCGR